MTRNLKTLWSLSILVAIVVKPVHAAPPADPAALLPENTLLFVSHAAADLTAEARRGTALEQTLTDPQVARFVDAVWSALDGFLRKEAKRHDSLDAYLASVRVASTLWRSTTTLAVLDAQATEQGPSVQAVLFARVGDGAKKLDGDVQTLLRALELPAGQPVEIAGRTLQAVPAPVPGGLYVGVVGDLFIVAVDRRAAEAVLTRMEGAGGGSLARSDRLKVPRSRIGGDEKSRVFSLYINTTLARERAETFIPTEQSADEVRTRVDGVLQALGLDQVKSICWEMHARGRGYVDAIYLYHGGRPSAEGRTFPKELLAAVPRDAWWAAGLQADFAGLLDRVLGVVALFDDEAAADARKEIGRLEKRLGFSIGDDLLSSIGPAFVLGDSAESGGLFISGITLVAESGDPAKFRGCLGKLVPAIAREAGAAKQTTIRREEYRDHTIEYVNVAGVPMPVAPAWSVHEKSIIVGLYPQMVRTTIDRLADGKPDRDSILANADVQAAAKVIGPIGETFSYSDTRAAIEQAYPWLLLLGQMGASALQGEGVKIDGAVIPSQTALTNRLFADVGTTRADPEGVLSISYGPLPVSVPVLSGGAAAPAMAVSILLPSLSRARELSKRTVCLANLRAIGQGMHSYAQDHDDKFPPDFKALVDDLEATPKVFICPSSDAQPGDLSACYAYIDGQSTDGNPRNVLVFEKPGHHGDEGGGVLFVDAHVEFVQPYSRVEELVRETRTRLAEEAAKRRKSSDGEQP